VAQLSGFDPEFDLRLRALGTAAREAGYDPRIVSGYRSNTDQARAIDSVSRNVLGRPASFVEYSRGIPGYAAPVGHSKHQTGQAADFATGPALDWLHANARRYGVSFPIKTDRVHAQTDTGFYGPVQDPQAREPTAPMFTTGPTGSPAPIETGSVPQRAAPTGAPPMAAPQQSGGMGLLASLQNGMLSPLFQSGAAMFSAASNGKDIGTGFVAGGEAAQRAIQGQTAQRKAQRDMAQQDSRDRLWSQITSGKPPAWASNLPPGTLDLAQALGPDAGSNLITQLIKNNADRDLDERRLAISERNADRLAQPEIVRQMAAAGIDPASPEGQQIIRNSIKGGGPLDQMISQLLSPGAAPAAGSPPSPVQPQSFDGGGQPPGVSPVSMPGGGGDPNLIPVQTGSTSPAAPAQPAAPAPTGGQTVNVFGQQMPVERARMLAQAFAAQGKGDLGKMIMDQITAGSIGKEGQNELDKKMIAASDNLTNLAAIKSQFKPEYQQIETRLKMKWAGLKDKFSKDGLPPEEAQNLRDYAAYRADAFDTVNTYVRSITGAAMTDAEAQRILQAIPKPGEGIFDGDSPNEFQSKLDGALRKTTLALARYTYAKNNGKDWQFIGLNQMENIVKTEAKKKAAELRGQGVPPDQLKPLIQRHMHQNFGVDLDI